MPKKVLVVGTGNMGSAIVRAGVSAHVLSPKHTFVLDNSAEKTEALCKETGVQTGNPGDCDVLLLAVKPQSIESVFPIQTAENSLLISVLAGTSVQKLKEVSHCSQVARVMPNTPALVHTGVSGIFFSPEVSKEHRAFVHTLFSACGTTLEVHEEEKMHAVTALSGSGPAYFFRFVECLISAGEKMGLSKKDATLLAEHTFFGAAKLLQNSGDSAEELRKKVTSKGGTTEAALAVLKEEHFESLIRHALQAAKSKSETL